MKKVFQNVAKQRPRVSGFDLSHEKKLSAKMGNLIPVYMQDLVPGDEFKVKTEIMLRMAPLVAPIMHRVDVYMHYFFVPTRIIWNQWEDFITGGQDGLSNPTMPIISVDNTNRGPSSLADYLGLPEGNPGGAGDAMQVQALPFRAYQKIYQDYYIDPNVGTQQDVETMSTADLVKMRVRAWEKDYFTSGLPTPQRGPQVEVPISGATGSVNYLSRSTMKKEDGTLFDSAPHDVAIQGSGAFGAAPNFTGSSAGFTFGRIENIDSFNLTSGGLGIEELREASALQRWLETAMRGGWRYIEQIKARFGVTSPDQRLQRPKYLGGGKNPIQISEVLNTSDTANAPQGNMAGHGIAGGTSNAMHYKATEHGYIMGLMSVLPRTAYQQGLPRHWTRLDKTEYFWPEFANLGEQAIYNRELYYNNAQSGGENDQVWGYQQRYAEYKHSFDTVHGDFKQSLDFWHMGRKFTGLPPLNENFMISDPTDRIFAVTDGTDYLWVQLYNNVKAKRPIPFFAIPSLR